MLTQEFCETKEAWLQLRWEASFWKSHHRRATEREKVLKAKLKELEATPQRQEDQIKELTAGFQKTIEEQNARIEELKAQNVWLKQRLFGRQSEQSKEAQGDNEIEDAVVSAIEKPQTKRPRGQQAGTTGHGRKSRDHLPSVEIVHDLKEHEKSCPKCGLAYKPFPLTADCEDIHYEVRITRRVHKRKSYLPTCNCGIVPGIVTAMSVPKLIPKGMFSVELWAHILAEKFLFQRPMSRLLQGLALQGLHISQGTITGGLQKIKEIVHPLYIRMLEHSREARHRHMDETPWQMFATIDGKEGHRWWLWVDVTKETVVYILDPTRSSRVPKEHLGKDPQGILSVDRYVAYKPLESENLKISYCWGHVRRDYVRIHDAIPRQRLWAQGWINRVNAIFHLNNNRLKVLADKESFETADKALRQELNTLRESYTQELTSDKLHPRARKALKSLGEHWDGLLIFVDHPEIPMDNNLSERKLREAALGRKNYYGSGAIWSGDLMVALFTIFQTARHNGLDPIKYLTAYLHAAANNGGKTPDNIDNFLPWHLSLEQRMAWKHPP